MCLRAVLPRSGRICALQQRDMGVVKMKGMEGMSHDGGPSTAMREIVIDRTATPNRRIMIVDGFGQRGADEY